jgi:hypothetical protein
MAGRILLNASRSDMSFEVHRRHTVLHDATNAQLAIAVEENLYALFRAFQVLPGAEVVERPKLSFHHAFPMNPMFKGVWNSKLAREELDAAIDEVVAWFKHRGAAFGFWWTGPSAEPSNLSLRLQQRGFDENIPNDPGMAADLYALVEPPLPEGLVVKPVREREGLEHWRDVFNAAYDLPTWAGQAWVDASVSLGAEETPWTLYVAYLRGEPVATNILFLGAGVAGLYGIGTLESMRGRGIGAAITLQPLLDARARGYRYSVLYASEMGAPVYRRLGFIDTGCRIGRYLWLNT